MRTLLLISVVAAGCGISSYGDFRDQLATRWCDWEVRCGEVGASEAPQGCSIAAPLALTLRGAVDVQTAIAAHRMIFHPDNAAECLDAVKHAPCDPAQAADDFLRSCHGVVTAGVATGGTCWGDDECVGGLCVAPDCGGVCTAFAVPGGPCLATGGTPDVTCDPSVQFCGASATCERKGEKGAPCTDDVQCLFDFVCVAGKCGDPPRVQPAGACGTDQPLCADGLYCDQTGACAPLLAVGQPCALPDACQGGLVCTGGVCTPWLDAGGACTDGGATAASGCPATQTCSSGACTPAPGAKGGPLTRCATDPDCADGLECATGNFCYYVGGVNADCQADRDCAQDLQCLSGACHTPGYIMCAPASM